MVDLRKLTFGNSLPYDVENCDCDMGKTVVADIPLVYYNSGDEEEPNYVVDIPSLVVPFDSVVKLCNENISKIMLRFSKLYSGDGTTLIDASTFEYTLFAQGKFSNALDDNNNVSSYYHETVGATNPLFSYTCWINNSDSSEAPYINFFYMGMGTVNADLKSGSWKLSIGGFMIPGSNSDAYESLMLSYSSELDGFVCTNSDVSFGNFTEPVTVLGDL